MDNQLTDREFWTNYWESKPDLVVNIPKNYLFHRQLENIIKRDQTKKAIELGGFPGYYTLFLKKYLNVESTLFDYFIHREVLQRVLERNGLGIDDIGITEADLFNYEPKKEFDLVLSCGLIEHFNDTKDVIGRHINFLKPGGTLFITLPNFRGVNGWVQKIFDRENYLKHNINCMNPDLLAKTASELGLKSVKAHYWGGFSVWLENKGQKSFLTRAFIKMIWGFGKVISKIISVESKLLSPYIVLEAKLF